MRRLAGGRFEARLVNGSKGLLGRFLFGSRLTTGLLRNSAVVVAFHRVRDTAGPEDLTVSVSTFERYCRFFRRRFHVVPLTDLVKRLRQGATPNRELSITFDDGYLYNYKNAAPILERFSLPATFFIVTQWMETDLVPWWDEQQGLSHPWMTWD